MSNSTANAFMAFALAFFDVRPAWRARWVKYRFCASLGPEAMRGDELVGVRLKQGRT